MSPLERARELLLKPGEKHWLAIQKLMAGRQGAGDYGVLRDYVIDHLASWPGEVVCSPPFALSDCGSLYPNDPAFYLTVFANACPASSARRQILTDARERLRQGDIRVFHLHKPPPVGASRIAAAAERFGQAIPADVRAFYEASDGFALAMMASDNEDFDEVAGRFGDGFGFGWPDFDYYGPRFDVYFNLVGFDEVFGRGLGDEYDQHEERGVLHTRMFAHEGTVGHFFCFYPASRLGGCVDPSRSWVIGAANDHWIAFDDFSYLTLEDHLVERLGGCGGLGRANPDLRNAFAMISFDEGFMELNAADWEAFPYQKRDRIPVEDGEAIERWFEARRQHAGHFYSRPRLRSSVRG